MEHNDGNISTQYAMGIGTGSSYTNNISIDTNETVFRFFIKIGKTLHSLDPNYKIQ